MELHLLQADRIRNRILARPKRRGKARWRPATPCGGCWTRYEAHRIFVFERADRLLAMTPADRWAAIQAEPAGEFVWGCEGCWQGLVMKPRERVPAMNEITDEDRDHELAVAFAQPRKMTPSDETRKRSAAMEQASQMRGPALKD